MSRDAEVLKEEMPRKRWTYLFGRRKRCQGKGGHTHLMPRDAEVLKKEMPRKRWTYLFSRRVDILIQC